MSNTDTTPGLLSKMVKFVRNPATNWSDLDSTQVVREDAVNKQLLKEMIERKRRNDFVRTREFDMLRKLRKREAMAGVGQDPGADRPSFFQSSLTSRPDERAQTLKKIDEIEAQMSQQWWKTKTGVSSQGSDWPNGASKSATIQGGVSPAAYAPTEPSLLPKAANAASTPAAAGARVNVVHQAGPVAVGGSSKVKTFEPTSFSESKTSAVEVELNFAHDPELEEVAIRFANGDNEGAASGLLETLGPGGERASHVNTWLTLFDLYRANGWQDKFESAAIDFVGRFDRSAPQWFSMPLMVKKLRTPSSTAPVGPAAHWICPSVMGMQSVAALKAALNKAPMPWRLDWRNLKTIEPAAAEPLLAVFNAWAEQPVELRFHGDEQLLAVLQKTAASGDRSVAQHWWALRMEALRVMQCPDDFELVALDFCVTYEVSPPAWDRARCHYKSLAPQGDANAGATVIGEVSRDSGMSTLMSADGDTQYDTQHVGANNFASVDLSGEIGGDVNAVLERLDAKLTGADVVVISCAKLIRVDFSAAGALLNWVSARQQENRQVQFVEVNRLVAAFFGVVGINEHAAVGIRTD